MLYEENIKKIWKIYNWEHFKKVFGKELNIKEDKKEDEFDESYIIKHLKNSERVFTIDFIETGNFYEDHWIIKEKEDLLLKKVKNTLERCIIILDDNEDIKDDGELYTGKGLVCEINDLLMDLWIYNIYKKKVLTMKNEKIKVSYQKNWDKNGTCYTQTIKIPIKIYKDLQEKIKKEIENDYPRRLEYCFDDHQIMYLKNIDDKFDFLTATQLRFIKLFIKNKRILDRNTFIESMGYMEE